MMMMKGAVTVTPTATTAAPLQGNAKPRNTRNHRSSRSIPRSRNTRSSSSCIFPFVLLLAVLLDAVQSQQNEKSSEDLEAFRLYPMPESAFSCGWGDVFSANFRAQLVRDAAEDCLREDNVLFQLCGFAIDDPSVDVALLSAAECRGTYVRVPGGRITSAAFNPSSEEVRRCVQRVLEQSDGCLVQALQAEGFPDVQSIQMTADVPQVAPTNPPAPAPAPAPTEAPVTSQPTSAPTQSPSTGAPTMAPVTLPLPTSSPITEAPVPLPPPTPSPITDNPTEPPVTDSPTVPSITDSPTDTPITDSPTEIPITDSTTEPPITDSPTEPPSADSPEGNPTTQAPSAAEVPETSPPSSETAPSPTNPPVSSAASSSNTNTPTDSNDVDPTVTGAARGEGDAALEPNDNSMVGTIAGAAAGGAVLVAVFAFIAWRRRRDDDDDREYNHKLGSAELYASGLPQKTYSLDGDNVFSGPEGDHSDKDPEVGSATGLSMLDSLQQQQPPTSPSSAIQSRTGSLRLLSTMPVILSSQSRSISTKNNDISTVVVSGRALGAGHDELDTTATTALSSHNNAFSLPEDGSMSSSFEEAGGATAEHEQEEDDSLLIDHDDIAAINDSNDSSSDNDNDDMDDDRRSMLSAATGSQMYDTRSVLSIGKKTGMATELSQEVMIVEDEDDEVNDSGASWKNRWIRPSIVASLQSLRPGGKNKNEHKNSSNNELYISGDSSSARTPSPSLDFGDANNIVAEEEDDESTDFRPSQDWNPDDTEVSPSDNMSNGELSFMAKTGSRRSSPSTNSSEQQQQGEELDGLDILAKLRLSPTPTEVEKSGSIRRKMFTPRYFLHKG